MAGVKGRSGGARPNSGGARPNSGGKREGAGRKPKPQEPAPPESLLSEAGSQKADALEFLRSVMMDVSLDIRQRVDAAKALAPFEHAKKGEGGKKEQKQEAAEKVAKRFQASAPPKLVAAGGKKV